MLEAFNVVSRLRCHAVCNDLIALVPPSQQLPNFRL